MLYLITIISTFLNQILFSLDLSNNTVEKKSIFLKFNIFFGVNFLVMFLSNWFIEDKSNIFPALIIPATVSMLFIIGVILFVRIFYKNIIKELGLKANKATKTEIKSNYKFTQFDYLIIGLITGITAFSNLAFLELSKFNLVNTIIIILIGVIISIVSFVLRSKVKFGFYLALLVGVIGNLIASWLVLK